jgi:hypothetical protein
MADEQNTNWEYKPADINTGQTDDGPNTNVGAAVAPENLTWTAKEFIEHERGGGWYAMLILATMLVAGALYLVTKDFFGSGTILAVGVATAAYVSHKPKELIYEISSLGVKIGDKQYGYGLFKSFSVIHEGQHSSISLESIKKFMPPMTLYFPPENEDQIANAIGNHLPLEKREQNITERLAHRFRL